jgi:7-cyano-7-deazaguanine reductase
MPPRRSRGGDGRREFAPTSNQRTAEAQLCPDGHRGLFERSHRLIIGAMPQPELLATFPNPYPNRVYEVHMTCPEFTSLCPIGGIETDASELSFLKGGAPDFATIAITYVPLARCLELKSLKLYLWSFRNDGIFYERAVNTILDDLASRVQPRWMRVSGDFSVRGGIKSVVTAEVGSR